jgi:hypothetical protein
MTLRLVNKNQNKNLNSTDSYDISPNRVYLIILKISGQGEEQ